MLTVCIATAVLSGCTLARRCLAHREAAWAGGRVRLKPLWNRGGAFGLPLSAKTAAGLSAALLALVWLRRKAHPVSAGLLLGGGVSNLWERLRRGQVLDYLRFPRAPGPWKRYVYNLADLAIFLGCLGLLRGRK